MRVIHMRILMIDRDIEETEGIKWFLRSYLASHIEFESATSCLQLEEQLLLFQPELLLIETELITASVQQLLQQQTIPIIALTTHRMFEQAHCAIQVRAVQLFVKPIPLEELKSTILTLPVRKEQTLPTSAISTEAQLYLDLYLKDEKKINLKNEAFFLIETAQFKHNLILYEWLIQTPIFDNLIALPLQKRIMCLVKIEDPMKFSKSLRLTIQEWKRFSGEEMNIAIYNGEETTLNAMYNECKKVLSQRFYKGYSHIFKSSQSIDIMRLDPLLTPEQQQLWITSLERGDQKTIKSFLYKLTSPNTFYHHDVRIHLTSILAQIRRFMMKYHLQQQAKIEDQYRKLFYLILEHPILYAIIQEFILFTQTIMHLAKDSQQHLQADYAELAISIIERDFAVSSLSLKDVAAELNISINYLSNVFSSRRGIPFKRFLQQYRVQQAAKQLLQTDLPISAIAEEVGYLDSNYFIKVFKEYYHITPYRYRKQNRSN